MHHKLRSRGGTNVTKARLAFCYIGPISRAKLMVHGHPPLRAKRVFLCILFLVRARGLFLRRLFIVVLCRSLSCWHLSMSRWCFSCLCISCGSHSCRRLSRVDVSRAVVFRQGVLCRCLVSGSLVGVSWLVFSYAGSFFCLFDF